MDDAGSPWNATRQTSISLREWDIPYEELKIADKIGSGRFSTGIFLVFLCGDSMFEKLWPSYRDYYFLNYSLSFIDPCDKNMTHLN